MAKAKKTPVGVPASGPDKKQIAFIVGGVVALLALVAVIIVAFSGNDDRVPGAMEQQPVTVTGSPLPSYRDQSSQQPNEAIGSVAPELRGRTFTGEEVKLEKDGRAKIVMIVSHSCVYCREELPRVAKWIKQNSATYPDVQFQAISTGASPSAVNYPPSSWFKREKWELPVLVDNRLNEAASAYGLSAYPYTAVLDANFTVLERREGATPNDAFEEMVKKAQASVVK